jgi:hypothetical protein
MKTHGGVVNFMPWLFYLQVETPHYPLDRRLGGFLVNTGDII